MTTKTYSSDMRRSLVRFVERGHSRREAAREFGVSASFAVKLLQLWRRSGAITPHSRGGWRHSKLAPYRDFLIGCVKQQPDVTMPELAASLEEAHSLKVDPSSLSRFLRRYGFTYKKIADGKGVRTQ
jgi:transposase|tara:strand:- start:613 stop:993 length:381 start_codon:yes stop_codon:yes gene_type:complete